MNYRVELCMLIVCALTISTLHSFAQTLPIQELLLPEKTPAPPPFDALDRGEVIRDISFSSDGGLMAIVGNWIDTDFVATGFIWNLGTDELKTISVEQQSTFHMVDISSDGNIVVTAGGQGDIVVWDLETSEPALSFKQEDFYPGSFVQDIKFLDDGRRIMTSYISRLGSGLYFWDANDGEFFRHIPGLPISNRSILSDVGRFVFDPPLVVIDLEEEAPIYLSGGGGHTINHDFTEVYGLAHIESTRFYYTVWDARTDEVLQQGPEEISIPIPRQRHTAWSRDGRFVFAAASESGGTQHAVMDARTGEVLRRYDFSPSIDPFEFEVQQVCFLPDGKRVAVAGGRYVQIYDLSDLITDVPDSEMHED